MENKLRFIIDPFIKFKSSISIESMSNKLELKHIILNQNNRTHSYINSNKISGFILSKLIYFTENGNINKHKNINAENINSCGNNNKSEIKNNDINNNLALKPSFMKTNINLSNLRSCIKN